MRAIVVNQFQRGIVFAADELQRAIIRRRQMQIAQRAVCNARHRLRADVRRHLRGGRAVRKRALFPANPNNNSAHPEIISAHRKLSAQRKA